MKRPIKVFISQPIHGKTEGEYLADRERLIELIKSSGDINRFLIKVFGVSIGEVEFTFTDTYHHEGCPPTSATGTRIWNLGQSISMMHDADMVILSYDYFRVNECNIESEICKVYRIPAFKEACKNGEIYLREMFAARSN